MAASPLIDFSSIDLGTDVVSRQVLDGYLRQRNRMAMLDGILHEDVEKALVVGYKDIRAGDWWASDHFPGRPMFPGALQIEVAAQLASYDFAAHRLPELGVDPERRVVGFGGIEGVRFRGLVEPDCRLLMVAALKRLSARMFRYATQGFVEDRMVYEGEVLGVLV